MEIVVFANYKTVYAHHKLQKAPLERMEPVKIYDFDFFN